MDDSTFGPIRGLLSLNYVETCSKDSACRSYSKLCYDFLVTQVLQCSFLQCIIIPKKTTGHNQKGTTLEPLVRDYNILPATQNRTTLESPGRCTKTSTAVHTRAPSICTPEGSCES